MLALIDDASDPRNAYPGLLGAVRGRGRRGGAVGGATMARDGRRGPVRLARHFVLASFSSASSPFQTNQPGGISGAALTKPSALSVAHRKSWRRS